jgi:hypothetical protein
MKLVAMKQDLAGTDNSTNHAVAACDSPLVKRDDRNSRAFDGYLLCRRSTTNIMEQPQAMRFTLAGVAPTGIPLSLVSRTQKPDHR